MRAKLIVLGFVFVLLFNSCAHQGGVEIISIYTAEAEFERAHRLLDHKKYAEAAFAFEQFMYNHGGSALVPDAIYYQGESRFLAKEYTDAITAFERVVTEYPSSAYADRAQYSLGICFYKESPSWELDQEMTEKAIETFRVFLVKFPQSQLIPEVNKMIAACQDKLAHKLYDSGRIYLNLRLYDSARLYFRAAQQDTPISRWSRMSTLGLAESDFREKKYGNARKGFEALTKDPDMVIRKKAQSRLADIDKRM